MCVSFMRLIAATLILINILINYVTQITCEIFTVGYITGAERRPGDVLYERPGRTISGAITLAVNEINDPRNGTFGQRGHRLEFIVAETYGEERTSILQVANLWKQNVSGYIGPQETCFHEGRLAAAFNLPMISYFCTDHTTSNKQLFPTFARTRPPDTQISKSVASVLLYFKWTHVVFLYLNSSNEFDFGKVARTILETFRAARIHVETVRTWNQVYYHNYGSNPFYRIVKETYQNTRIYVILGYYYEHLGLMIAMSEMGLLRNGEYFVVGVDIEEYDANEPAKYFREMLTNDLDPDAELAFQSYISIKRSSAGYSETFARLVNEYLEKPPFNYKNPLFEIGGIREIQPEAAYLYDAVHLYAQAVVNVLENHENPLNGTAILNAIKGCRYKSAMGFMVYMDENGDAEGNYTLLAKLPYNHTAFIYGNSIGEGLDVINTTEDYSSSYYGLFPVGIFSLKSNDTQLPILHLTENIQWVNGRPPIAVLRCGFRGEKCISHSNEIVWGTVGGTFIVMLIVLLILYRNWRYEQELDSLLWKIDFKEIEIHDENNPAATTTTGGSGMIGGGGSGGGNGGISGCISGSTTGTTMTSITSPGGNMDTPPSIVISNSTPTSNQNNTGGMDVTTSSPSDKTTRAYHPLIRTSQVSLSSNPDADFRYSSIFTKIGIYKGRIYAIKTVNKKSIDITREMKKELKIMRDLRHNNLNAFIGACTDPPNICIITEYCSRGSLKDILENEEVKLDNMFVASIVADILRGMIYLHDSPVRFHGALCPSNCLVDSRWVVKVADFGLHEFKKGADDTYKYAGNDSTIQQSHAKCEYLLYRAPELLRRTRAASIGGASIAETNNVNNIKLENHRQPSSSSSMMVPGTQKGDVYSFAITLYELHSRHGPFGETNLTPPEILQRVIAGPTSDSPPFRPNLESLENSFDFVTDCLKDCWAENPDDRPDFKMVRTKLRPLRKGMKPNIFDNMMAMMEKYANNLEVLVDERTDQLQEEKKKTEALLLEMLPRPVAEQLKRGHKVEAESYDCVTIYFSDIVGFTSMSAESTPLQVVDFLNDLYTCFDSIIENYDVYKVETIGDAYMVVSGLPIRNEDQHAAEIATMSLHLLSAVTHFTIRHRPSDKLKLRIGIHSGPVCAGVVGLKMPRYCLFGDTVNTASRMESTGEPLKIHCSQECKDLLDKLGGYTITERGLVEMKGKGEKMTYWLLGEDELKRMERNEARAARRSLLAGKHGRHTDTRSLANQQSVLDLNGIIPRSSLKNRNASPRSPLSRCASLESPKRLRFASGDRLELFHHKKPLDSISDSSPVKKSSGSLIETCGDCCSETLKTSSSSCPCIENIANSTATLEQAQLASLPKDSDNKYCLSIPTYLYPNLISNEQDGNRMKKPRRRFRGLNDITISVPSKSPPRRNISALAINSQYLAFPFVTPEFINASTPLLNVDVEDETIF